MRSIDFRVTGSNTVIITAGGAGVPYARIQHEGGVIRPKHGKYLAIPLCAKAAASTPRAFENTFVAKGIIWQKPPEGGTTNAKPIALYKLKKQVVIPARPYMYIDAADRDMISRQLLQYVAGELKKAIKN
jgi:phage gpG-like protein